MTMMGNIKVLTSGVTDLTKAMAGLDSAVSKTGAHATGVFGSLKGLLGFGGQRGLGVGPTGNVLQGSLGTFSALSGGGFAGMGGYLGKVGAMNVVGGAAQVAMAPFSAAFASTMDTTGVVNRAAGYYQATARAGGAYTRNQIERATFSALQGGMTSVGSDQAVASILTGRGYTAGTTDYLGAARQVKQAAVQYGMQNEVAAGAIASMQSGSFAANAYQYGITVTNPNGSMKSTKDISRQILSTFGTTGVKATAENLNTSYLKGNLGPILEGLGLDAAGQQLVLNQMIEQVSGKKMGSQPGNKNPLLGYYGMNTSQTSLQQKSETNVLKGIDAAASTVQAFNTAMGDVISSMAGFKAYLDGVSGTNAGKGIKQGGNAVMKGLKKIAGGALIAGGVLASEAGVGIPMVIAGTSLLMKGGGTPGFGGSFGRRGSRGGGTPGGIVNGSVSAIYGQKDNSGIWASTGNTHLGTDYDVPVGTPVYSKLEGTVSGDTLSSDYGNAILIDHPNGYSTLYAHLSNKEVSPGDVVLKGQEIGKSGKSGNTTGPGLHFEVRKGKNNPVDPSVLGTSDSPISSFMSMQSYSDSGTANSLNGTVANNTNIGNADQKSAAAKILAGLGAPTTANNIAGVVKWMQWEGGLNHNNPMNTTLAKDGATNWNSVGVKTYQSLQDGIDATVATLTGNASGPRGYDAIVGALKKGDASVSEIASLVNASSWGTKIKGGGTVGYGAEIPHGSSAVTSTGVMPSSNSGEKNVYITVKIDQANEANAIAFANKVQRILNDKNNTSLIGSA